MIETLRRVTPGPVKSAVKSLMRATGRHWVRPALVGRGTIQDLYYWVADGRWDTNVLLNNFYSVFFPTLDTATSGTLTFHDAQGTRLGTTALTIGHLHCIKLNASRLLQGWCGPDAAPPFGSLLFALAIPPAVLKALSDYQGPFYFWHRFYIEYLTPARQPAFVHCVDKTLIWRHGASGSVPWYPRPAVRDWAPEMPVNIDEYRRLHVILMNRSPRPARLMLTVEDPEDHAQTLSATIPPGGVHRFELTRERLRELTPRGLRLRVSGMPTTWGRPVLFKEFENGTISVMHC